MRIAICADSQIQTLTHTHTLSGAPTQRTIPPKRRGRSSRKQ